ncbi:unnamed protein product [Orchesella dallaii]|uniref:EF-hand domain-containing protein n=1 Tax=Orchesella dallaii TaxID=48710 RepID=A0ABP1QFR5_9HEXA
MVNLQSLKFSLNLRQYLRLFHEPKHCHVFLLCLICLPCLITCAKVGHSSGSDRLVSSKHNEIVDIDIVGFGEDCSEEGPFCDVNQHLTCDPVEETCLCDEKEGYVHVNELPAGFLAPQMSLDDYGLMLDKQVCVSTGDIEKRTDELLGLEKKTEVRGDVIGEEYLASQIQEKYEPVHKQEEFLNSESVYADVMKNMEKSGVLEQDDELLRRFKLFELERKPLNDYTFEELVVDEIVDYGYEGLEAHMPAWKKQLKDLVKVNTFWKENSLATSICSRVFDVDLDGQLTHKEYVISIYSKVVLEFMVPKVFLSLIGSLVEHDCISQEDLLNLDHSPYTFAQDFDTMDVNKDGCLSLDEFEGTMSRICRVNWFTEFLKESGLDEFRKFLEPTPEEAYLRMLKENDRLSTNWNFVDKNLDGLISYEELCNDLEAMVGDDVEEEALSLMNHLDRNGDGKASFDEVKLQISVPSFTDDFHYEWLESLYGLYETDQADVMEELDILLGNHNHPTLDKHGSEVAKEKLFYIFDKDGSGELDQVELKLLLEVLKKYVVHLMLELTVFSLDQDSDGKLGIQEYEHFFSNMSSNLSLYFTYLMTAQEDELLQEIADHVMEDEDEEMYEERTDENGETVIYYKLLKKAGGANETFFLHKLFRSLDTNSDGFLTKEDFYYKMRSKNVRKTDAQLKEQFSNMDVNKDGELTEEDGVENTNPISFESFKTAVDVYGEEIVEADVLKHMGNLDLNGDSLIQLHEFELTKNTLVNSEDEVELLDWLEKYFSNAEPSQMDPQGAAVFSEFDTNCDGFISKTEFQQKVEQLRQKTEANKSSIKLSWEADVYFKNLDLSKDGRVSYNEFDFLLLRNSRRINE